MTNAGVAPMAYELTMLLSSEPISLNVCDSDGGFADVSIPFGGVIQRIVMRVSSWSF